jgi:RecA-family ATPase
MEPARDQIEIFVEGLFRHASRQGYVSLRAFHDNGSNKVFRITPTGLSGGLKFLIDVAEDDAGRAANWPQPVVFCPPIAVFVSKDNAKDANVAEGLALSVECDKQPREAKLKLEQILGSATFVVASGGKWTNPETGETEDKLHLHWRLNPPARGEDLAKLKEARGIAARLVGGDPSNKPICHPIRWPGSWHRKAEPTLCRIIEQNPDSELDLATALAALEAIEPPRQAKQGNGGDADDGPSTSSGWAETVRGIIIGDNYHEALARLAMKMLQAGMSDGATVNMLRALMENTTAPRDDRWLGRYSDISRAVSTARQKLGEQPGEAPPPLSYISMSDWDSEPVPEHEWTVFNKIPRRQCVLFSGEGSVGKSTEGLHLCAAHVLGRDCWSSMPERGPAIYIDAEDDDKIIHRRLAAITKHYEVTFSDLIKGGLHLISLVGQDAVLAAGNRGGKIVPTPLYGRLLEAAGDIKPVEMVIASSANVFAGSEIDRSQVQQFVSLLTRLAIAADGSIVLISHPSLTGINNDSGLSGNTQWHNSVRARVYMKGIKPEEGEQPDTDLRELVFKKNNYGPVSESLILRYQNGLYLPVAGMSSLGQAAQELKTNEIFLRLLRRFTAANRFVSAKPSANYAPALFAKEDEAKTAAISSKLLEAAMRRLFKAGTIWNEPCGRPSRPSFRIALKV